jgi:hypothetical protein
MADQAAVEVALERLDVEVGRWVELVDEAEALHGVDLSAVGFGAVEVVASVRHVLEAAGIREVEL